MAKDGSRGIHLILCFGLCHPEDSIELDLHHVPIMFPEVGCEGTYCCLQSSDRLAVAHMHQSVSCSRGLRPCALFAGGRGGRQGQWGPQDRFGGRGPAGQRPQGRGRGGQGPQIGAPVPPPPPPAAPTPAPAAAPAAPSGILPGQQGSQLTTAMLAAAPAEQQKQMLGERLFPLVQQLQPELAGKITGMLLEMDNSELLVLLESSEALVLKIDEAISVLRQHNALPEDVDLPADAELE